jgi:ComF family protein
MKEVRNLLNDFISLFYPLLCNACLNPLQSSEREICTSCSYGLPRTDYHLCADNPVMRLFWGRAEILTASAYYSFQKGEGVQRMLHRLKYKGQTGLGIEIGRRFGAELKYDLLFGKCDLIIPVPLHPRKLKIRRYNQSELFAIGLSHSMRIPVDTTSLQRVLDSESQTKQSRFNRWKNVADVFQVRHTLGLERKQVLLVDDVITTGATLEACIKALSQITDVTISIAAIAIASD